MYSGTLRRAPFQPDPAVFQHAEEREAYIQAIEESVPAKIESRENRGVEQKPESLAKLLEMISPEDSALVALAIFLLCDNSENDVVLLGILLYVLLSK
jgi:hypothetical protein